VRPCIGARRSGRGRLLRREQGLNFTIPYTLDGEPRQYVPDFIARVKPDLTLIVEVSGGEGLHALTRA
jgi:hypothetical protein